MNKSNRDWGIFKAISTKDKKFRYFNLSLMLLLLISTISFLIYFIVIGDPKNRLLATISMSVLTVAPFLVEILMKKRFNNFLFLCYLIYLFLSGFLGCVLNFYNTSFLSLNSWYDIFIHTFAGYCFCFVGIFFLARLEEYSRLNIWTIILFAFSFTLAVELVWELLERFADVFLGQSAQGIKIDGYNSPLLIDTIEDIICNFSGGIIFIIHFFIGKTKNILGVDFLEREIAYNGSIEKKSKKVCFEAENKNNVDMLLREAEEENNRNFTE